MQKRRPVAVGLLLAAFLAGPQTAARAQGVASGAIAGVARDSDGGVLPGVTVEAASPALIEKVRNVVTDGAGQYKIVDLRPGVYTVTFSLPGFTTLRREGVELTTGFTAAVNADMSLGALEETITVTTLSPLVDVQNVLQQQNLNREVRDALPLPSNSGGYVTLIPGATQTSAANQDVGGSKSENTQVFVIHGSRAADFQQLRDGMFFGTLIAPGNYMSAVNTTALQEVNIMKAGGVTAEIETGGAQVNIVPRDGGNTFRGSFIANYGSKGMQSNNLDDALRARGAATPTTIRTLYEVGAGVGGPVKDDRLWYFLDSRRWVSSNFMSGLYYNQTQGTLFYTPDLSRQAYDESFFNSGTARLTWQASQKDKITGTFTMERNCDCFFNIVSGLRAPEATSNADYWPNWRAQTTWRRPATNRLLFEAGLTIVDGFSNGEALQDGGTYDDFSVLNAATNFRYGAPGQGLTTQQAWGSYTFGQWNGQVAASYITGSHAFKVGAQYRTGWRDLDYFINHNMSYTFRDRVPLSITYFAGPVLQKIRQSTVAAFVQDQWTVQRLTLNLGLRLDVFEGWIPEQHLEAGTFRPAVDFPRVDAISWRDINPRAGGAVDVFGNGKTAVKASIARYVTFQANSGLLLAANPVTRMVTSATRTWNDANGDYVPQDTELGPLSDSRFGTVVAGTQYADEVLRGWGNREYSWQGNVFVQQELWPGISLNAGYFRTWYGNFTVTDNLAVTPGDFSPYCVSAPSDTRLPSNISGQSICGFYDLKPEKFGQVNDFVDLASKYGKRREVFTGFDLTMSARFGDGGLIQGGVSTQRRLTDSCFVVDSPQQLYQCEIREPWSAATQFKVFTVYPLPWDFQASVTLQNLPPIPTSASFVATNGQIAPSLGRNLGSCGTSATCNGTSTFELIPLNTLLTEPRSTQVNIRLTRNFQMGRIRLQPQVDFFNAFNENSVLAMTTRYGAAWQRVSTVLGPRLIKFGLQANF
jgi:hypothetical protein